RFLKDYISVGSEMSEKARRLQPASIAQASIERTRRIGGGCGRGRAPANSHPSAVPAGIVSDDSGRSEAGPGIATQKHGGLRRDGDVQLFPIEEDAGRGK